MSSRALKKLLSKVRALMRGLKVYYIIVLIPVIIFLVVYLDFQPTEAYEPNNWVRMSIAFGASILTVVGIFASIISSDENSRRAEFTEAQEKIKRIVEERERFMPEGELKDQYTNALNKINMLIEERAPLRYRQSYIGFGSFFSFLFSAMSAIYGLHFKIIWIFFLTGVVMIISYILDCIIEFRKMDKVLTEPSRSSVRFEIPNIMVNGQESRLYIDQINDEKLLLVSERINVLNISTIFHGKVRNGFLHAHITYNNKAVTNVPHRDTFLMDMGFIENYKLATYSGEDTGVLNSEDEISLTFNIPLRIKKDTAENKLLKIVDFPYLGNRKVYEHPSLSNDFSVKKIVLCMYEDPFYRPKRKRREVALIIINVKFGEATPSDSPVSVIHLPGMPENVIKEILEKVKSPEGTFSFIGKYDRLWDESKKKGILLQIITGKIVYRLERDENYNINFYFASPETGTRIATVDAKQLKGISQLQFFLTWSPEDINLYIGSLEEEPIFLKSTSRKAETSLLVGNDGAIYEVGIPATEASTYETALRFDNLSNFINSRAPGKGIWVQDLEEGKTPNYIKNSEENNPKLIYFTGPSLIEKKADYVGMYYRLRPDFFINRFVESEHFVEANERAKELKIFESFTDDQINEIIRGYVNNVELRGGFESRPFVHSLFKKYFEVIDPELKEKYEALPETQRTRAMEVAEEKSGG